MKIQFFLTDIDYCDVDSGDHVGDYIRLWGRTTDEKFVCLLDNCEKYYYHLIQQDLTKKEIDELMKKINSISFVHAKRVVKPKKIELVEKKLNGKKVIALKIYTYNHKDLIPLKDVIKTMPKVMEREHKEEDINFVTRYLIEKNLKPCYFYTAEIEENDVVKKLQEEYKIEADILGYVKSIKLDEKQTTQTTYVPKVMAFDIEAETFEIGKGKIIMISICSEKTKKVVTWKKFKTKTSPNFVEFVDDEKKLIEKFIEIVRKEKPDFLVGYFSDGFDMPYLKENAKKNKVKLVLSLDNTEVIMQKGKITTAKTSGISHIDLFRFIENFVAPSLRSETLTLNEVASELIGEEKIKFDFEKIKDDKHFERFIEYNLQDSILVYKLFHKLWPQMLELSRLVAESISVVTRSSYSQLVEHYIIHNIKDFDEIIEHRPFSEEIEKRRLMQKYVGAFVLEPKPGLYEDLVVFDFRSLYPSIIISYNISPASITKEKTKLTKFSTPEFQLDNKKIKLYFEEKPSFIPVLLKKLVEERKKVKELKKTKKNDPLIEARDLALKTLANAHYGYFGFFGARYYSRECAASITALGRWHITQVIEKAKKEGFDVLYADTDGVCLLLKNKTKQQALDWLKKVNRELPKEMELELEDFYKRGMFVTTRAGLIGAKKKYALLSESGKLKIRGFETVRRDWCDMAKEVQNFVIESILKKAKPEEALAYVKKVINDIKNKKIGIEKLIIKTQIKKEIEAYEAYTPHVEIAKRMIKAGIPVRPGTLVEYVVCETRDKKAKIREKVKMPEEIKDKEYDADYYINNQILPAVENIFAIFKIEDIKNMGKDKTQKSLSEFQ